MQLEFSPEDLEELDYERFRHPLSLVQRRMEALWLKSHGLSHGQIAQFVIQGPASALHEHHASLEASFRAHPPATIKEAQHTIEALTGIKRSETQVREYLKKTPSPVSARRHAPRQSQP
jgi:hypothetical protein